MTPTAEGLRVAYPVIDDEHYRADRIAYWLAEAQSDVRENVWGVRRERGVYAYAAHRLIMERAQAEMNDDGLGGMEATRGTLTSESDTVDGVCHTASYSAPLASAGSGGGADGDWGLTLPGVDYQRMARIVGMTRGAAYAV